MRTDAFTPIELWATRSKIRAFGYLIGLALLIAAGSVGAAGLLAGVVVHGQVGLVMGAPP